VASLYAWLDLNYMSLQWWSEIVEIFTSSDRLSVKISHRNWFQFVTVTSTWLSSQELGPRLNAFFMWPQMAQNDRIFLHQICCLFLPSFIINYGFMRFGIGSLKISWKFNVAVFMIRLSVPLRKESDIQRQFYHLPKDFPNAGNNPNNAFLCSRSLLAPVVK
jgi:hypothetical protein